MSLCKRIIARLDIKGTKVIKGVRFEGLRIVGDPYDLALRYYHGGADEILYIDSVASLYGRNNLSGIIRQTVRDIFVPVTAGGGVRSVSDAAALLAAGADKIAVNTAALLRPELITELSQAFGSQCVVASIQARRMGAGAWEAMAEAGREPSGHSVLAWIERVQQLGAGEILLTSVDQDGTCAGPDQELQAAAAAMAEVPLVFGGGFSTAQHVHCAMQVSRIAGVCVGAALHQSQLSLSALKAELSDDSSHSPIRLNSIPSTSSSAFVRQQLLGHRIGVVDYGMGNQQSLINALSYLGATSVLSSEPNTLQGCSLLTLPGVGAFPQGMAELQRRGLDRFLCQWVEEGLPLLGICLGMQMLFESSEEFVITPGLGLLQGHVLSLPAHSQIGEPLSLPHIGWNQLVAGPACQYTPQDGSVNQYFVHTYAATGVDFRSVLYQCEYGGHSFVAAVKHHSLVGLQFHPERSGPAGLALLAQICGGIL